MTLLRTALLFCIFNALLPSAKCQVTAPVNGVADVRNITYAFTNATVVKDAQTLLNNVTLLIKMGKIVAVGNNVSIPADATVVDCTGKFIYPSFIDIFSDYGIASPTRNNTGFNFAAPAQLFVFVSVMFYYYHYNLFVSNVLQRYFHHVTIL